MTQSLSLTVEAGLQAEQDLLAQVCSGDQEYGLLFWQPSDRALVMPRRLSRLPGFEQACEALAASGWPVLLRETGGEPVPQSAATINIALVYAPPRSEGDQNRIETGYRRLCQPICDLLSELGANPPWVKSRALSAMAGSTSISTGARWLAPPSVGVRARAGRVRWDWCMARCCWMTSGKPWSRRSIVSTRLVAWSSVAVPRAILPCMRRSPRQMPSSAWMPCIGRCWRSSCRSNGCRIPPWSCL